MERVAIHSKKCLSSGVITPVIWRQVMMEPNLDHHDPILGLTQFLAWPKSWPVFEEGDDARMMSSDE